MKRTLILCAVVALAACGDNNDNAKNTNGGNSDNGTAADAGNNNSGTDTGDDNVVPNNGMDAGANNNNGEDTGGNNNTTGDMGMNNTTGDMGMNNNTTGDMGSTNNDMGAEPRLEAHDCTFETAMDMTGAATVSITDIAEWSFGHSACIIVDTGTEVTWTGNFRNHPLEGGVSPNDDVTNPIDIAGVVVNAMNGNNTAEVTFAMAGDYPYFCGLHVDSMQGVVYVTD